MTKLAPDREDSRHGRPDPSVVSAQFGPSNRTGRERLPTVSLAVLGFLVPAALYFWLIHRYALNVFFEDQWFDLNMLSHIHSNKIDLSALWAQHNENRMLIPNLAVILLAATTHLNVVFEEYVSAAALSAAIALLVMAHRRRSPATPWLYYCPVAILMFCFAQAEDTLWGFQLAWYLVLLMLALSVFLLDRPALNGISVAGAIVAAIVGSFCSLEGLLIWAAGLVLLVSRRRSKPILGSWTVAGIATAAVYFNNFRFYRGYYQQNPTYGFHHPVETVKFLVSLIGLSNVYVGAVVLAVAVWVIVARGFRRDETSGQPIGIALICFGLLFAVFVTDGRSSTGFVFWRDSRYATFDLLTLVGCYMAAILDQRPLNSSGSTVSGWSVSSIWRRGRSSPITPWQLAPYGFVRIGLVAALSAAIVLGFTNGIQYAHSWYNSESLEADVTANIDRAPDNLVVNSLAPGALSAPNLRALVHFAQIHRLGVFDGSTQALDSLDKTTDPTGRVLVPRNRSILHGSHWIAAAASDTFGGLAVTSVEFRITGSKLKDVPVSHGWKSPIGWLGSWNTASVPDGSYGLWCVVYGFDGTEATSRPIEVTVAN